MVALDEIDGDVLEFLIEEHKQIKAEIKEQNKRLADRTEEIRSRSDTRFYVAAVLFAALASVSIFGGVRSAINATDIKDLQGGDSCGMTAIQIDPEVRANIPLEAWLTECPGFKASIERRERILEIAEESGTDLTP